MIELFYASQIVDDLQQATENADAKLFPKKLVLLLLLFYAFIFLFFFYFLYFFV
jgi:hypothetical protein